MEIALAKALPTYSGGLGMLAGDTLRSAADTGVPLVAISLVHRRGYFEQHLDSHGQQTESDVVWSPETTLPSANQTITIALQGREITLRAWRFDVIGHTGHIIPVFLLDADVEGNDPWDRRLTDHLYGGDTYYRLCQEAILGLGGIHLLHALGMQPEVCHMNEGHAALLSIGLLEARVAPPPSALPPKPTPKLSSSSASSPPTPLFPPATISSASTRCARSSAPTAPPPSSASAPCTTTCST